jgi:hypothetical protein
MSDLKVLVSPATIRARTSKVFDAALAGETAFAVELEKLPGCVDLVMEVTQRNYPSGEVPVHGRYEHMRAGGVDRVARLLKRLGTADRREQAKALVDAVVVSVLLDAGAGDVWRFEEGGQRYGRSEGLAVASASMFEAGAFSHDGSPSVTAAGLKRLTVEAVASGFQVSAANQIHGLEGRVGLLQRLGEALERDAARFGVRPARPGHLIDALGAQVSAPQLLEHLLLGFASMWPARVTCEGVGFGDVWAWRGEGFQHWVPFHKLSQWLTYSLLEPVEHAGVRVRDVEQLTGLPEYRNGGLLLDTGVLRLRDSQLAEAPLPASHQAIIEWRALTVQLLDRIGAEVQRRMGKTPHELPLARVLQGGTWAAGRVIAAQKRAGGGPPLRLVSDGTVF